MILAIVCTLVLYVFFHCRTLDSIEEVTSRLILFDERAKLVRNYFGLASERITVSSFSGLVFNTVTRTAEDGSKMLSDVAISQIASEQSTSTLTLPSSLFTQLSAPVRIYRANFYSLARTTFFPSLDTRFVASDIISASIDGLEVSNLREPVVLTLRRDNVRI